MRRNVVGSVMGAVVLMVAGIFVSVASEMVSVEAVGGYGVTATFYKIGGL